MSLTYSTWLATIANLTVIQSSNANLQQILPSCIDYAEQRLYRELDLLNTVTRQSGQLTSNIRNFSLPTTNGQFVVTNGINLITPATATVPDNGTRNQMVPVSRDFLDAVWGSVAGAAPPTQYAMITDQTIIVGPWPDQAYTLEVVGTIRPNPLSATNTSTYLTTYLPDLFVAASMVFMQGYQRDWGAQSDDPASAISWEGQYGKLFASANLEEMRKKYSAGAWSSLSPTPNATPSR